jgi:hypothetical protein
VKLTYLNCIDYEDEKTKLTTSLSLKKLGEICKTDIYNRFVLIDNIALSNGKGKLNFGKLEQNKNSWLQINQLGNKNQGV